MSALIFHGEMEIHSDFRLVLVLTRGLTDPGLTGSSIGVLQIRGYLRKVASSRQPAVQTTRLVFLSCFCPAPWAVQGLGGQPVLRGWGRWVALLSGHLWPFPLPRPQGRCVMTGSMVTTVSSIFTAKDRVYITTGDFYQKPLFRSVS